MLRDSVVIVVHRRAQAIPLAMITMRKSTHGFPFASHMGMGLRLVALRRAAGAPLVSMIPFKTHNDPPTTILKFSFGPPLLS